ncbi:RNA polymerase sigma-70 factor (ECF subfamily) [Chitinophaga niastensis]|uniref:RNA polymerase sigma-70 factor (ECF subfamily) n=1 Tax=Chitinophaga niastensis TaxID=536980 RepID=A0A2P8HIL3_CHINA|nr:sigma-70 family RNA polymerase sigma factor [Chitinophaga niastensis]PSL46045.1 RNA polymerase sigma-70 factor (ECF subfamily) [Chitinophaga niastensis]
MNTIPDKAAFLQLIQENRRIIFKICTSYCYNQYAREDLAQEIIYQLWKSSSSYNADYKFTTWMYRIALNVAISFYRKGKSSNRTVPVTEHLIAIEEVEEPVEEIEEQISLLQQYINQFNELDRALMILYLEEKSYREIGEILGITETNVATKLSRLKARLKQNFSNHK